jgi:hypothetical protein
MDVSDEQTKDAVKRDRSPKFPYIGLGKALERVEVLYGKVKRYEARVADIAKDWDLSPKSSSTDRTVAAIQSFGLIEDSGSGENRKIKRSELGARILADRRPGVRESLLAEAALKPPSIADYARRWGGGRPDEAHALSQLQFEGGFTADAAKLFLRVFDETIRFTAGVQDDKTIDSGLVDDEAPSDSQSDNAATEGNAAPESQPKRQDSKSIMKEDVFSLAEGDVTLQWPVSISADSYQDLEDWTKLMLRKIKRSIDVAKPHSEDRESL